MTGLKSQNFSVKKRYSIKWMFYFDLKTCLTMNWFSLFLKIPSKLFIFYSWYYRCHKLLNKQKLLYLVLFTKNGNLWSTFKHWKMPVNIIGWYLNKITFDHTAKLKALHGIKCRNYQFKYFYCFQNLFILGASLTGFV